MKQYRLNRLKPIRIPWGEGTGEKVTLFLDSIGFYDGDGSDRRPDDFRETGEALQIQYADHVGGMKKAWLCPVNRCRNASDDCGWAWTPGPRCHVTKTKGGFALVIKD